MGELPGKALVRLTKDASTPFSSGSHIALPMKVKKAEGQQCKFLVTLAEIASKKETQKDAEANAQSKDSSSSDDDDEDAELAKRQEEIKRRRIQAEEEKKQEEERKKMELQKE